MLGNILGILFAALSDIFINGFSLVAAVVGEFLPAAGPNLIFAAILVPLLVGAYAAVQGNPGAKIFIQFSDRRHACECRSLNTLWKVD